MSDQKTPSMQEVLNKKNVDALAISDKNKQERIIKLEEDMVQLKRLVTNMTLEVQQLKSSIQIQKIVGPTA